MNQSMPYIIGSARQRNPRSLSSSRLIEQAQFHFLGIGRKESKVCPDRRNAGTERIGFSGADFHVVTTYFQKFWSRELWFIEIAGSCKFPHDMQAFTFNAIFETKCLFLTPEPATSSER